VTQQDMEDNRFRALSDVIQKYTDNLYEIPSKTKTVCFCDVSDQLFVWRAFAPAEPSSRLAALLRPAPCYC